MIAIKILVIILYVIVFAPLLNAEIFIWTDENGVKHFSNTGPQDTEKYTVIPESEYKGEKPIPPEKTEPITKEPEKAPQTDQNESQSQPESQADVKTDNEKTSEDNSDKPKGPCISRYLKKKAPNGSVITLNDDWVWQIEESFRSQVVEEWEVGNQMKVCLEDGIIINMTRDETTSFKARRLRRIRR
ncbi:MAG: DUF4124 domain-containing protein [Desulfobacterales bacterium]